jgi:hypothetical protein
MFCIVRQEPVRLPAIAESSTGTSAAWRIGWRLDATNDTAGHEAISGFVSLRSVQNESPHWRFMHGTSGMSFELRPIRLTPDVSFHSNGNAQVK